MIGGNERNFFSSPVVLNNYDDRANNKYQSMKGRKSYNCVLWQNTPRRQNNEDIKISFALGLSGKWEKWLNDVFYSGTAFEGTSLVGSGHFARELFVRVLLGIAKVFFSFLWRRFNSFWLVLCSSHSMQTRAAHFQHYWLSWVREGGNDVMLSLSSNFISFFRFGSVLKCWELVSFSSSFWRFIFLANYWSLRSWEVLF